MLWVFNGFAILLTLLIGFLYHYGIEHSLFWHYAWYDSPLHVLSGMVIGLWASAVSLRMKLSVGRAVLFMLVLAAVVGVAWEVLELSVGLTVVSDPGYMLDTLEDILCDLAGALVVTAVYWTIYRRRSLS